MVSQSSIDGLWHWVLTSSSDVFVFSPDNVNSIGVYPVNICINPFTPFYSQNFEVNHSPVMSCHVWVGHSGC